ncbi:MAG: protein-disulfide reductase DsbD [Candidatus Aminicenantes bacterium]|nr:protein-disulfide reductase DsbD [Candidatus Aminicenantes bacterium]
MKKIWLTAIILWLVFLPSWAQEDDPIVSVKVESPSGGLKKGESADVTLIITIKKSFHINSNETGDEFTIPTAVTFEDLEGLDFGPVAFPEAENKKFEFSVEPLPVFEGTIRVEVSVSVAASFRGDEALIQGKLSYQACTDISCMPPADVSFKKKCIVAESEKPVSAGSKEAVEEASEKSKMVDVKRPQEEGFAETVGEKGLFLTFLLIFLGGLALDLTPCVYPVIPITVGYFGGQSEGRRGGVVAHAVFYVLGMSVTYSTLGVVAALTGSLFGAALQSPPVLIGIAVVLVALALSMFDLYEFRLPSFLNRLAGGARKGYFGALLMGLTVGIVAAPCVGPFVLGLLTYVGERGSVVIGFLMFFVLSLGLGLPFLFLAVFSGSINKLPRSGAWMVWVRTIFGFVLLAMAVYFLGPLFPDVLTYNLTLSLVLLVAGIYMAWIEPTKLLGKIFPLVRNIIGILFFAAALFFAVSGVKSYVAQQVEETSLRAGAHGYEKRIHWSVYSKEKIEEAAVRSLPVFLDFYAEWCIPCKEMDAVTFVDQRVVDMSRNFIMLKVDLTDRKDATIRHLRTKFDIRGVPTYVFLKPDGTEMKSLRIVGFVKPENLRERMERVLESR